MPKFRFEFERMESLIQKQSLEVLYKIRCKKFTKFTEKYLCWILFFIKKRLRHRCFSVNFWKFLTTASFIEHLWATASVNLYPLDRYFCYFQQKLTTIKYTYIIQVTDRCTLYNVHNNNSKFYTVFN